MSKKIKTGVHTQIDAGEVFRFEVDQFLTCCDCGLVHFIQFDKRPSKMRVCVDVKRTRKARKRKHYAGLKLPHRIRKLKK